MNTRIEALRKHKKMSRAVFGAELGVSGDVINNLERGRVEVKEPIIRLICAKFNVNEEWLRTGEGEMFNKLDMENELMAWAGKVLSEKDESFKKRFVKMLMSLNEEEWEILAKKSMMLAGIME